MVVHDSPGAYLALYTDGLIEHSKDVLEGEQQLVEAMRAEIVERGPAPALSVMQRVFGEKKNSDDAAALFVAANDDAKSEFVFNSPRSRSPYRSYGAH